MDPSTSRLSSRVPGWKAWACSAAVVGLALTAAPAGAATPTVPGPPTGVSATPGVRSAKVSFTKPIDNGGSKVNGYRVKCSTDGGKTRSCDGSKSPVFVAGLTAGKTYSCTVRARNAVGFGPASEPSDSFQPRAVVPGSPTSVSATAGSRSVKVGFTKPADNGGSKILNYRAKCAST